MNGELGDLIWLADWRRRVAELYAIWRARSATDPQAATLDYRAARDRLFREHPQSPLPAEQRAGHPGLRYWPYDPAYRLTAVVESAAELNAATLHAPIALPASGSQPFVYRRAGRVKLTGPLAGASLTVFWMEGYAGGLFLPFRDATSGDETYAAGRYLLDTIKGADLGGDAAGAELVLDFNMAYHPSCAYDLRWNCPLSPPQNALSVAVAAGERLAARLGDGNAA